MSEEGECSDYDCSSVDPDHVDLGQVDMDQMDTVDSEQELDDVLSHENLDTRAALPVGLFTDTFTPNSVPTCGEEYLAIVRHQRRLLPSVFSVDSALSVYDGSDGTDDTGGTDGTGSSEGEPDQKAQRLEISCVSSEFVNEILFEFDAKRPKEFAKDRDCLKELAESVKTCQYDQAFQCLLKLDNRLTSNQVSLLRAIAKESDDLKVTVVIACRFDQKDLLKID